MKHPVTIHSITVPSGGRLVIVPPIGFVFMDHPCQSYSGKWCDDLLQTKNLNIIQAIIIITIEYFSPAITLPSPIWPATRPEKNA